jgi:hypothetical protein
VVEIGVLLGATGLPVLEMVLRVLQVVRARRITPTYRAFLEVALQDITSTERVLA